MHINNIVLNDRYWNWDIHYNRNSKRRIVLQLKNFGKYTLLVVKIATSRRNCGWNYHDAIKRIEICLKTLRHIIPVLRVVSECTIKGEPVYDVASKAVKPMVA